MTLRQRRISVVLESLRCSAPARLWTRCNTARRGLCVRRMIMWPSWHACWSLRSVQRWSRRSVGERWHKGCATVRSELDEG